MSVLLEYAMFPTDKGESVSQYVSQIVQLIKNSGFEYKLTAMGTIVETNTIEEATAIINKSYSILEPYCNRVYASIKLDIQKNKNNRILSKIKSIEDKIGKV
ncbi:MAG: MTH1187 family thiamine-binding protein [Bacteroidales bacterium]|nr:MTH1187 family thiamine-binding protein [Bacteroidales bacterium]